MSRKQFKVASSTHEKKITKKERKEQNRQQAEMIPTEEDTAQIKNLTLYAIIGIGLLLMLMYWIFINSL